MRHAMVCCRRERGHEACNGVLQEREGMRHAMVRRPAKLAHTPYVADAPGDRALLAGGGDLVGLALDAQVHDVISADGAIVHHDVCGDAGMERGAGVPGARR